MKTEEAMENLIGNALENDGFFLNYQPIFNVEKERFTKAEVLLRMKDKCGNTVSPCDFIPVAEKNGTINNIGLLVIKKLAESIKAIKQFSEITFSVNVSPVQLKSENFAEQAVEILKKHSVSSDKIVFELTETVPYEYEGNVKRNINSLRKEGYSLSLDDVGKGSSNLMKASVLPVEYIKIDKQYIDRIAEDDKIVTMLRRIIKMSKSMKIKTVAEGVENETQRDILKSLSCEFLQGYLYSKPLPENEFCLKIAEI